MEAQRMREKPRRNEPCWCRSGKKYKKCHMVQDELAGENPPCVSGPAGSVRAVSKGHVSPMRPVPARIECPDYATTGGGEYDGSGYSKPTGREMENLRETCHAARRVLDRAIQAVHPGVTTDDLDAAVHNACIAQGGYPSPRKYHDFPKSVCTSVNEVICHGIPDDRPLENGDIVNIDVTMFLNGVHADCSETVPVGDIDQASRHLIATAHECMVRGIAAIRPNGRIRDIGCAIDRYAHKRGCSVVRAYCGHGIGRHFHSKPSVPHFCTHSPSPRIEPGMIFTVEPMINMGTWKHRLWDDGWTAVTADGQRSAQFEHTVLVTEAGAEILTHNTGRSQ